MTEKASQIKSVLFVCTGNSCRSVMAEYVFKKIAKENGRELLIGSAGTSGGGGITASPEVVDMLRADGMNATKHQSQAVKRELLSKFDLIIVMTKSHSDYIRREFPEYAHKVEEFADYYHGQYKHLLASGVPDPVGMGNYFYRNVYEIIKEGSQNLYKAL